MVGGTIALGAGAGYPDALLELGWGKMEAAQNGDAMPPTNRATSQEPSTRRPKLGKEEFMRRGNELYERIRPQVEEGNRGKVVAIDLETGTFEVAADTLLASTRLLARCPDAQTWFVRIGYDELFRIGPRVALAAA